MPAHAAQKRLVSDSALVLLKREIWFRCRDALKRRMIANEKWNDDVFAMEDTVFIG